MKKEEEFKGFNWTDFGEDDKVTEEMLGIKRSNASGGGMAGCFRFFCVVTIGSVLFFQIGRISTFKQLWLNLIWIVPLIIITRILEKASFDVVDKENVSKIENLKATVKPVKGKITKIVRYKYYLDGGYRYSEWVVFAEYYNSKLDRTHVVKTSAFERDISQKLRSNKVDIYLTPNGKFEVSGFEFRNRDNPEKADIPIEVREIYETSSSIG